MIGKLLWPILFQFLGIIVIIAEFILPSMGILYVVAAALFGYSLYLVFSQVSIVAGYTFVVFDLCLIPVLIIFGIRLLAASPVTLRKNLAGKDGVQVQPTEWSQLIGLSGETLTDLHPSGNARINGKRYDVVSRGDYIPINSTVTVLATEGNRIVVKRTDSK